MNNKENMLNAIYAKKIVELNFIPRETWVITTRKCIPFDIWPRRRKWKSNWSERFHFYDLNSPDWKHTLSILPEQVISIKILNESFNPWDYITWETEWFVRRDWWIYS
jgi:hypothetical protein